MEIHNGMEGLRSLLGVNQTASGPAAGRNPASAGESALGADSATLSSAASEMAQAAGDESVRVDKVAAVQASLAAGTYQVPASAVASKLVDAMLDTQK